jgi:putative phosphoesterase
MTRTVMRVGLISDTHGLLRSEVAPVFHGVDLIVHAGDVGGGAVLDALSAMAPVEVVYGNVDDPHDPRLAPELTIPVGALTLHVSHGHELGRPTPALLVARYHADILVFGHTHRALVTRVERSGASTLIVNPGAAGPKRFDVRPSVAILTVSGRKTDAAIRWLGAEG